MRPLTLQIILLYSSFLGLMHATTVRAADLEAAKQGSVFIEFQLIDSQTGEITPASSSGFIVSPAGWIITTNHQFEPDDCGPTVSLIGCKSKKLDGQQVRVRIGRYSRDVFIADLVDHEEISDVALLKIKNPDEKGFAFSPLSLCSGYRPKFAEKLRAIGYPLSGDVAGLDVNFQNDNAPNGRWHVSSDFTHGMSGAPILREATGEVVAIVQGGIQNAPAVRYATPLERATALLSKAGLNPSECGLARSSPNSVTLNSLRSPGSSATAIQALSGYAPLSIEHTQVAYPKGAKIRLTLECQYDDKSVAIISGISLDPVRAQLPEILVAQNVGDFKALGPTVERSFKVLLKDAKIVQASLVDIQGKSTSVSPKNLLETESGIWPIPTTVRCFDQEVFFLTIHVLLADKTSTRITPRIIYNFGGASHELKLEPIMLVGVR
ncbi:serine protease [Variovorax sp. J22R133]|uniref:S1 family peptidase n=1 Tax=Variovorax brevis TaxID=3053503 RepID=UPI002578656F|nr:serine protease [Variovorax sp. J22R133]MDM0116714.1 serine protease [Variovorax sp. J22R133]